jgi:hypothetical protein
MYRGAILATIGLVGAIPLLLSYGCAKRQPSSQVDERSATASDPAIQADVQQLKDKAADQAHAMVSVAYHFNNLWFAAEATNWPLAEFYWGETRSHLRWAVRMIPVRKDKAGYEIKLAEILDAMENTPLKQLQEAIANKDHDKFVAAYKFSLETCYACHKAVDKPFLKTRIPDRSAEPTINFDPQADWPK